MPGSWTQASARPGLTAGQLLVSMGSAQLTGERFLVGLDRRRADIAGQLLEPAPTPAELAKRFGPEQFSGIEKAIGQVNTYILGPLALVPRGALTRVATIGHVHLRDTMMDDEGNAYGEGRIRFPPDPSGIFKATGPSQTERFGRHRVRE